MQCEHLCLVCELIFSNEYFKREQIIFTDLQSYLTLLDSKYHEQIPNRHLLALKCNQLYESVFEYEQNF